MEGYVRLDDERRKRRPRRRRSEMEDAAAAPETPPLTQANLQQAILRALNAGRTARQENPEADGQLE